ncbi:hypothetical protein ACWCXK_18515 [Streptomyces sp. NPDC001739]
MSSPWGGAGSHPPGCVTVGEQLGAGGAPVVIGALAGLTVPLLG